MTMAIVLVIICFVFSTTTTTLCNAFVPQVYGRINTSTSSRQPSCIASTSTSTALTSWTSKSSDGDTESGHESRDRIIATTPTNPIEIINPTNVPIRRRNALSRFLIASSPLVVDTFFSTAAFAEDAQHDDNDKIESTLPPTVSEEPKECQNGAVVSESAVPGAYQQKCMNLDERKFVLESSGDTIVLYQGTNAAGGMAGRTGVAIWNSGILLTRLLDKLNQSTTSTSISSNSSSIFKNKTILELGCGASLASIAVAKMGASSVIATDSNPEVLALARRNIERNDVSHVAKAVALQWGLLDATEYDGFADVIVGSDLTYNSGSWVALAESMATILKPDGIVIYLTLGHSGFNVGGELGGFLSVAENQGLRLLTRDSEEWKESIGSRSVDDLLLSMISPEERSVIDANGGVRVVILARKKYGRKS